MFPCSKNIVLFAQAPPPPPPPPLGRVQHGLLLPKELLLVQRPPTSSDTKDVGEHGKTRTLVNLSYAGNNTQ